jgi:hypothetical protein
MTRPSRNRTRMATWLWFIQTRADAYGTAATAEPSGYAGSRLDIDQECQRLSVFKHGASPTRFYGVELMSISRISCDFAGAIDAKLPLPASPIQALPLLPLY